MRAHLAEGRTNREIARVMFITEKTASVQVSNILAKLGAANRVEAAALAHRLGLVSPGGADGARRGSRVERHDKGRVTMGKRIYLTPQTYRGGSSGRGEGPGGARRRLADGA